MASLEPYKTGLLAEWTEAEITNHLKSRGLSDDVAKKFIEQVTGDKVSALYLRDHESLGRIGITDKRDRQLCLKEFNELQNSLELRKAKVFQDPIHGPIDLHPLLVKIIDTPQFQRLRDIKQLGGVYYVYPGASHNRFEHSIGVCHLAGEFIKKLRDCQPELNIDYRDVLCVKIAALCHDLGHGPFSHLYQDLFISEMRKDCQWKSEEASLQMLEYMLEVNEELDGHFNEYGLSWDADKDFIKGLIIGEPLATHEGFSSPNSKHFLYEIVSNKLYGMDVDKMDYIARDCHGLGITSSFDSKRYMRFCRVLKTDDGKTHICLRDKESDAVKQLFDDRYKLFNLAYQHKTKRSVEKMICEALILVDDYLLIPGEGGQPKKMSTAIDDMCAFTKLNDSVIQAIMFYPCSDQSSIIAFEEARRKITSVQERNIYALVNIRKQDEDEGIEEEDTSDKDKWRDVVKIDYWRNNENPVDKMWFYKKNSHDVADRLKSSEALSYTPSKYIQKEIRVYSKRSQSSSKCFSKDKQPSALIEEQKPVPPAKDDDEQKPAFPPAKDDGRKKNPHKQPLHTSSHNLIHLLMSVISVALIYFSMRGDLDSEHLPGVTIIQTRKFTVAGGQGVHFDWEDYGIEVSVPNGALPNGFVSTVTIHVSVSGPYVFPNPKKWKISSAVYWISSTKNFLLPVMIKIRHSVKGVYNSSKVRFLKATDENINGTFKFTEEPGGHFSASDSYGYISLDHFSGLTTCSDMDTDEQFYGSLFWKKENKRWLYSFLIHRHFTEGISRDLLKVYDEWKFVPETSVVFENDEVELILKNSESNWNLAALYTPLKYVRKQLLQSMEITSNMQFFVWQNNSATEPLILPLPLIGTKQPKHILLAPDPNEENTGPLVVTDKKIEDEHHLAQWADHISSSFEYCACLKIEITTCNQIRSDYRGRIKEQVIQISHKWYNSGERTWKEFASAFECMENKRIAGQIREKHSIINASDK